MSNLAERAIWTFIQSSTALIGIDALFGGDQDPIRILAVAATAGALSALKTISLERLEALRHEE